MPQDLEDIKREASRLLQEGYDGVIGLRKRWGHVGPHLFSGLEQLQDVVIEPRFPLATFIRQIQAKWSGKKIAAVARGCDVRALNELEKRGIFKRNGLAFIGIVCSQEQASICNCEKPVYDVEKCTGCWKCMEKCPEKAITRINVCPIVLPNEFDKGLSKRKAIYIPFAQAVPLKYTRDPNHCLKITNRIDCKGCANVCEAKAVLDGDTVIKETIDVGAVVLASGYELFNPKPQYQYGYSRFENVVTSIEFERILSASGPYQGALLRPLDRTAPQKIAFIQCVGSRDESIGRPYCSSVCCTYAIKEALIAKEHSTIPLDVSIFFMDVRTYGKDFDRYSQRAEEEHGVRFVRAKVDRVEPFDGTGDLSVIYADEDGKVKSDNYSMVVLSTGFQSSSEIIDVARKLKIQLNPYGFCQTKDFMPVETSRRGVYVCGAFSSPKDIPETVMQASGAAGAASASLASVRKTLIKKKVYPSEKDVSGEEPRIGVFVCHCGINIGGVVNVPEVKQYAATLPNVVFTDNNLYTCSQDTQEKIKQVIKEHNLNRVIVASCSPRTHEPMFRETLKEAGLNQYLFEMTNIRDQCSWVHMHEPEKATEKAKDLVRMAVSRARLIEPLKQMALDVNHTALVIGGGVAGMVAALNLAEQGFRVHLIERSDELGGVAKKIYSTLEGGNVQNYLKELINKVASNPLIEVHTRTYIVDASGYVGNFTTGIMVERSRYIEEINHGVTIIATGGQEHKPSEYLYGRDPRVLTSSELENEIAKGNSQIINCQNLVMIQCVGSRDEKRPYCSRVCCSQSIKNALRLKEINPEMNIYILYRDVRTYGFKEEYYQEARNKGIIFIRYNLQNKPRVTTTREDNQYLLKVTVKDPIIGEELVINTDILTLAAPIVPSSDGRELAQLYKVPLNEDGFFIEAHIKLRPVDFSTEGVFLCGLAHSPKSIEESIAQAKAAAGRATTILVKEQILGEGIVSTVNENICSGCGVCEVLCPYQAIAVDRKKKVAAVNEALCKGCGTCCVACPSGAAQQRGFKRQQISAMISAALELPALEKVKA